MSRLIDYFVVCSLKEDSLEVDSSAGYVGNQPPLHRPYTPQVLCHFPKSRSWNSFDEGPIKTQCMPDGVRLEKNLSSSNVSFHSMLITRENGTRQYGSVLTFYEPIHNLKLLDSLESLQNEYKSRHRMDLSLSDQYWYFSRTSDTLYASKCLCLVTSLPIIRPCQSYLKQLYAITVGKTRGSLPIESYLYNLLYETPMPAPGRNIQLHGPLGPIWWHLPGKSELPLCDYSFKSLFESLSLKSILQLLTCVLLEQQILLKAADFHQLMLCAECITALLFPFSWPHVFVPILPSSQHGFLDAPVPFIMGLRMESNSDTSDELDIINITSLTSFDLDHDTVETPEDLPLLPDYDKLVAKLTNVILQHDVTCPDLIELQRQTSPSTRSLTEDKRPSIIDAIRLVKSLSESPRQSPKPGNLPHQTSVTQSLDNPIVKELHGIIVRSGRGTERGRTSSSLSPTTGEVEASPDRNYKEEEEAETEKTVSDNDLEFSSAIRSIFCEYFVEHFANYEHFIIMPNQTYSQWLRNREQFQNFDKTAFLSDQPIVSRAFYSAFLETSMFSAFIDQKLISTWDPDNTSNNLVLFDNYVESHRHNSGIPTTPSGVTTSSADSHDSSDTGQSVEIVPKPHPLNQQEDGTLASAVISEDSVFPSLDSTLLTQGEETDTKSIPRNETPVVGERRQSKPKTVTDRMTAFSHSKFVLQLWRESRLRVKHMLGSSPEVQNNIEENTHITNLCDLLERIWGHGLKKRESKSPLWAHLMAHGEILCHEDAPPPDEIRRSITPDPYMHSSVKISDHHRHSHRSLLSLASLDETSSSSSSPTKRTSVPSLFRRRFQSPELKAHLEAILQPPPSTFLEDLQIVNNMREIKTDVGHARAWVRLALEKKNLSRHLSNLLSNTNLCRRRYRNYAFLLTEDEKEQFLLHLLSLSAGDFNCFTSAFTDTNMSYKVLVVGEGKYFGLSTACLYVNVGGENGESGIIEIPRGSYSVEFTCHNLGSLTCIRLGHDNTGIVRSLLVEMVLVHCVTTGQTYRFHCAKWFARAEDDGSIERFIIGERVSRKLKGSANISALSVDDVLPSSSGGSKGNRSPKKANGDRPVLSNIKSCISSCVAKLMVVCQDSNKETLRSKLLPLLYGPGGFVKCLESVLYFGFKCTRKFQKSLYIWDLIERATVNTSSEKVIEDEDTDDELDEKDETSGGSFLLGQEIVDPVIWQSFVTVVSQINKFINIGKDEKAMLFFLLGLRDHHLPGWLQLLAHSYVTQTMYEPASFLRDPELFSFLMDNLKPTLTLSIYLEPLLVQGRQ